MKRIILTAVLMLAALALVFAQPAGDRPNHHPMNGKDMTNVKQDQQTNNQQNQQNQQCDKQGAKMECPDPLGLGALNLTDDQKAKVMTATENNRKDVIMIRADIATLRIDKQAALRTHDFATALKITDQIADKQKLIEEKRIQLLQTIYGLLTPDQQKKWKIMDNGEKGHKGMKGMGCMQGMGGQHPGSQMGQGSMEQCPMHQ